jgi:protein-tyrosine-phosphatase
MTDAATPKPFNVLFLCTGNSARSILAEAILSRIGGDKFKAFSAGSYPKGEVNPAALRILQGMRYPTEGLRSKSWDEFTGPDAPPLDFVFTVCDAVAGEVCPIWPGQPMTAHCGLPDPAAVESGRETDIALAFAEAYRQLNNRITLFASLPIASLSRLSLQHRLDEIGKTTEAPQRV